MDAMLTALRRAHCAAEQTDPDVELVAAWDAWRREWFAFKSSGEKDDSAVVPLDRRLIELKPKGLRGIAAKAGYALWSALTPEEKEGFCGLTSPLEDMDWHVRCVHELACDLERLTGVVVHPRWDIDQSMTQEDEDLLSFLGQVLKLPADVKADVLTFLQSWDDRTSQEREAATSAFRAKHGVALSQLAESQL